MFSVFNQTEQEKYEKMKTSLETIQSCINGQISLVNNDVYNFYLDEVTAMESAPVIEWEETPCDVTQEQIDGEVEEKKQQTVRLSNGQLHWEESLKK